MAKWKTKITNRTDSTTIETDRDDGDGNVITTRHTGADLSLEGFYLQHCEGIARADKDATFDAGTPKEILEAFPVAHALVHGE